MSNSTVSSGVPSGQSTTIRTVPSPVVGRSGGIWPLYVPAGPSVIAPLVTNAPPTSTCHEAVPPGQPVVVRSSGLP